MTVQALFIQDADHPYIQEKPFDWIRGYRVKSLIYGAEPNDGRIVNSQHQKRHGYGMKWADFL